MRDKRRERGCLAHRGGSYQQRGAERQGDGEAHGELDKELFLVARQDGSDAQEKHGRSASHAQGARVQQRPRKKRRRRKKRHSGQQACATRGGRSPSRGYEARKGRAEQQERCKRDHLRNGGRREEVLLDGFGLGDDQAWFEEEQKRPKHERRVQKRSARNGRQSSRVPSSPCVFAIASIIENHGSPIVGIIPSGAIISRQAEGPSDLSDCNERPSSGETENTYKTMVVRFGARASIRANLQPCRRGETIRN